MEPGTEAHLARVKATGEKGSFSFSQPPGSLATDLPPAFGNAMQFFQPMSIRRLLPLAFWKRKLEQTLRIRI